MDGYDPIGNDARAKAPPASLAARVRKIRDRILELPAVARSIRALVIVAGGLRSEPITLRAAALTYLTILSLIPLLAVIFSVFQAIVGTKALQGQLQDYILENLAVGARESFQRYIETYIQKATGAALGGFGFVFLLFSSVSLLANIEAAFNAVFRAPRPRPLVLRIGIYWALLTLGPILLSLSIAGTAFLERSHALGSVRHVASIVLPLLVTCGSFTLLYLILPAVQVKRRSAVIGAFVAGTAWEVAKIVYAFISARAVRRDAIYGSLSAIPTFLLWTYVSWIIVLFGARIAYAAQAEHLILKPGDVPNPLERELLVARVMRAVSKAFHDGEPPPGVRILSGLLHADEALIRSALDALAAKSLVREVTEGGWTPTRPLERIPLSEVRAAARGLVERPAPHEPQFDPELRELLAHWDRADEAAGERLGVTMADLLAAGHARAGAHVTEPALVRMRGG